MVDIKLPESLDNALGNATGKVTETAGDLFDAALTYAGRNIIKKYKFNRADDDFQLVAYKQAQKHALKLQEIRNRKIEEYYGDYIERNIQAIAREALQIASRIPKECRLLPDLGFIGSVLEDAKYQRNETLQKLYAELLTSSVDTRKIRYAHPSFSRDLGSFSVLDAQNIQIINGNEGSRTIAKAVITSRYGDDNSKVCSFGRSTYPEILFISNDNVDDLQLLSMSLHTLLKLGLIDFHINEEIWFFETNSDKKYGAEKREGYNWIPTEIYPQYIENCERFLSSPIIQTHLRKLSEDEKARQKEYRIKAGLIFGYVCLSHYGKHFMKACS